MSDHHALKHKILQLQRFSAYHSFPVLWIQWLRDNHERKQALEKLNFLDTSVIDLGCNVGLTCMLASDLWAKKVVWVDIMPDTIELATHIAQELEYDITYGVCDLNSNNFANTINSIANQEKFDISLFLSVYGTQEFHQRDVVLEHLIQHSNKTIVVEWHDLESWKKYAKIFFKHSSVHTFEFQGYLRDSSADLSGNIRPLFFVQKEQSTISQVTQKIVDFHTKSHKTIIAIEWLAWVGKSTTAKELHDQLEKIFPDQKIWIIDDLKDCSTGESYLPCGSLRYKIRAKVLKIFWSKKKTLHELYGSYNILILSDYRIRSYIDSADLLIHIHCDEVLRADRLRHRWNDSYPGLYSKKTIWSHRFVCKSFYTVVSDDG